MQRQARTTITALGALVAVSCLAGCVVSNASRLERQLTATIQPDHAIHPRVAAAFGLNSGDGAVIALSAVSDPKPSVLK